MGGVESVPNPDERVLKMMEFIGMDVKELKGFWKHFRKGDRRLRGMISVDTFFSIFGEKRSIFGDGIFELVDLDVDSEIDFGKYLTAVITYCLFEPREILRFCFYVFDRDKKGYIEKEDLLLILRVLYYIVPPDDLTGEVRTALDKMEFHPDGKVDFEEFKRFHALFPALFHPAFRIQISMISATMGQRWWDTKKRALHDDKVRRELLETQAERIERSRLLKLREKRIRKKMGRLRYFCCLHQRNIFRRLFPVDEIQEKKKLADQALAEKKRKAREHERKLREYAELNPTTAAWQKYLDRKASVHHHKETHSADNVVTSAAPTDDVWNLNYVRPPAERRPASDRLERAEKRRAAKLANARKQELQEHERSMALPYCL